MVGRGQLIGIITHAMYIYELSMCRILLSNSHVSDVTDMVQAAMHVGVFERYHDV